MNSNAPIYKFKMTISYNGKNYYGWQRQPQFPSIQQTIEDALTKIFRVKTTLVGSGRTDRGVHALAQVAHFIVQQKNCDLSIIDKIQYRLQRLLPSDIQINRLVMVKNNFHAQISAISKTYEYYIHHHDDRTPFFSPHSWVLKKNIDLKILNAMSDVLIGEHDFSSFQTSGTALNSTIRTIYKAQWDKLSPQRAVFKIKGNGFLKHMVRNIVGTQIKIVSSGTYDPLTQLEANKNKFIEILKAKNRNWASPPAPGEGLFLKRVDYPS